MASIQNLILLDTKRVFSSNHARELQTISPSAIVGFENFSEKLDMEGFIDSIDVDIQSNYIRCKISIISNIENGHWTLDFTYNGKYIIEWGS